MVGGEYGGVWSRNLGVKEMGESRKATRKIYKMGIRSGPENARIYSKKGRKKREDDENGKKGNRV